MLPPVARHAGLTSAVPLAAIASPPRMVLPPRTTIRPSGIRCRVDGGSAGHADAEARRSVLTALPCATLVTAAHGPAPQHHHKALCIFLLYGARVGQFLISEVPL